MNKIDDYLRFQETALKVRGQRQQLLASNIANADTPNYKAKDIDFKSAMQNALHMSGAQKTLDLAKTSGRHMDMAGAAGGVTALYRPTVQGNIDGNTVDMDVERNQFAENAIQYESSMTLLSAQIKNMLTAITSQ